MKNFKRILGAFLIANGIFLAIFTIGRGFLYAPTEESGLPVPITSAEAVPASEYPSRLLIPKLEIDAHVQHLGVTASGNMAAPNNFTDVSWYKYGTVPGYRGSAVLAGHEDNGFALDGVFKHLVELEIGDYVYIVRDDGAKLQFKVVDMEIYPYDQAPLERIFNTSDTIRLNLITCAGDWLPEAKTNDKRLVVYTELVEG